MAPKLTQFKNDKDRNDFYIAIVVIVLFILAGLGLSQYCQEDLSIFPPTPTPPSNKHVYSDVKSDLDTIGLNQITPLQEKKIDRWVRRNYLDNNQKAKTLRSTQLKPKTLLENDLEYVDIPDSDRLKTETSTINEAELKTTKTLQETDKISSAKDKVKSIAAPLQKEVKKKLLVKESGNKPSKKTNTNIASDSPKKYNYSNNHDCLIMLGAFSESKNANRLIQHLRNDKYHVFTQDKNQLKTVGIKVPCQGVALHQTLAQVKEKYNTQAYFVDNK